MKYEEYDFKVRYSDENRFNGIRVHICDNARNGKCVFVELGRIYGSCNCEHKNPSKDVLDHLIKISIDKFERIGIAPEYATYQYSADFVMGVESTMNKDGKS